MGASAYCAPLSHSIRSVMQKYLEDRGEVTFEKIFSQKLGEYGSGSAATGLDFLPLPQPAQLCSPLSRDLASHPLRVEQPARPQGLLQVAATLRASLPLAVGPGSPVVGVGAQSLPGPPGKFLLWGFCF